jgi:hypothetical protein
MGLGTDKETRKDVRKGNSLNNVKDGGVA